MKLRIEIPPGTDALRELADASSAGDYTKWFESPYQLVGRVSRDAVSLRFNRTLLSGWATVTFNGRIIEGSSGAVLEGVVEQPPLVQSCKLIFLALWAAWLAYILRSSFPMAKSYAFTAAVVLAVLIWLGARVAQRQEERDLAHHIEAILISSS